jgi:hypothetical protein
MPVGLERVGLPAAAVQRQHPLRVQLLAQRLLCNQRFELADDLAMAAGGEVALDRQLERGEPQLLEPTDLGRGERLTGHVIQRRPVPQRQRFARGRLRDEPLEASGIDVAGAEAQLVAAPARDDLGAVAARGERLAQLGHVNLNQLRRGCRRLLAPKTLDQALARDRRARIEREHRQQRPRLDAAERDRPPIDDRLQRSKNLDVHITGTSSDPTAAHANAASTAFTGVYRPWHRRSTAQREAASVKSAPPRRPACTPDPARPNRRTQRPPWGAPATECPRHRRPQVREPPQLEPVAPDTFGGLPNNRSTPPLRAVLTTTTHLRGSHS